MAKIYINWETEEILSEADYLDKVDAMRERYIANEDLFNEYLDDQFTMTAIWSADDVYKAGIRKEFEKQMSTEAEEYFDDWRCYDTDKL